MMEVECDSASVGSSDKVSIKGGDSESIAAKKKFRANLIRTAFDGCVIVFLGMQASQKGPSFIDLQHISSTTVEGASSYFTASSFGYLVGALAAGLLFDRIGNKVALICIPLTLACFFIGLIPYCTSYVTMLIVHIVASTQCAVPETSITADQLHIWHGKSDTSLQFLSFCYSLGGVIGPLYTEPFLAPIYNTTETTQPRNNITETVNNTSSNFVTTSYTLANQTISSPVPQPESQLHYAFLITGLFGAVIALPFYYWMIKNCCKKTSVKKQTEHSKTPKRDLSLKTYLLFTLVASIFSFLYTMTEDSFNMFLPMFLVSHQSWTKEDGALISSCYWGIGTLSKLISAFLSSRLDLGKIMLISCFGMVLSLVAFFLSSHFHINVLIWISTSCFALTQAPVFGGCFSWVDSNIMKMDGKATSVTMVSASGGAMVSPLILGITMNNISLMAFPIIEIIYATIQLIHFLFMYFLLKPYVAFHYGSPKKQINDTDVKTPGEKTDLITGSDDVTNQGKMIKDFNLI